MDEILAVKERREKDLLAIQGVTGVGVLRSSMERIIIYVQDVETALRIPARVDDISVVSIVTGTIRPLVSPLSLQALTAARTEKWRPMPGGVSIGHPSITAGTGAVLTKDGLILSNNHVSAASNQGAVGDPIIQPGKYDGGKDPDDRIASLHGFVRIGVEPVDNFVDCAVSRPDDPSNVSPEILQVGSIYGWGDVAVGQRVEKSGRTTGLTSSTVIDVDGTIKVVGYPFGNAIFKDQVVFNNPNWTVIAPGDSGSLLFTWVSMLPVAVGLCFAGSETVGVANKMSRVISLQRIDMGAKVDVPLPSPLDAIPAFLPIAFPLGIVISVELQRIAK